LTVQLARRCISIFDNGVDLFLYLEIIAFCRELVKVAPAGLQPHCYFYRAWAMMGLQKLGEAEEILREGLVVCREESLGMSKVSQTCCPIELVQAQQSDTLQPWHYTLAFRKLESDARRAFPDPEPAGAERV
jgi:hypothetical protein